MCVTVFMSGVFGGQKWMLDFLQLELKMVVDSHVVGFFCLPICLFNFVFLKLK